MLCWTTDRRQAFVLVALVLSLGCATAPTPLPSPVDDAAVVIVPGMTGTKLCDRESGRVLWGNTPRLATPWDGGYRLIAPLSGAPDDVVPCGPILELRVVEWRKDIYGGLIAFMEGNGYVVGDIERPHPAASLFMFSYDWRRDNVESARQLARLLRSMGRVNLICQSNASYICRYAVRYGDVSLDEAESGIRRDPENVDRLILVGTANGGALRILRELNRGRQYIRLFGTRFRPEVFFTFPALFQDLPVHDDELFTDERGLAMAVDLFDPQTWRTFEWSIFRPEVVARVERSDRFGTEEERSAYLARALDSARRMHRLLQQNAGGSLPRYYSIQSLDFPTPDRATIRRRDNRWQTLFHLTGQGDRHATRESQDWLAREEIEAMAEPTTYISGRHFEMITTARARAEILRILTEGRYGAISSR